MSSDSAPRYRRRNRWPIAVVVVILAVAAVVVWTEVLKPPPAVASGCNVPTAPVSTSRSGSAATTALGSSAAAVTAASLGTFVSPQSLAKVRPANPATVPVRVLNASTTTGEAGAVTAELRSAGFTAVGQQDNDPKYPNADLRCYGEIRYGYAGLAEARTVLIVAPCAQLIRDNRADNSVDLVLGKLYDLTPIPASVKKDLTAIKDASAPPAVHEGRTALTHALPPIPPLPDRSGCPA